MTVFIFLLLTATVGLFQNCDRPYDLTLDNPSDAVVNSENEKAVVINGGATLTNSSALKLELKNKYAQEVLITSDPSCSTGEWQPFAGLKTVEWNDGDGVANLYIRFRNFRKEETSCFTAKITIDTTPPALRFTSAVNAIDSSRNPAFTVQAEEAVSGLARVECRVHKKTEAAGGFSTCDSRIQLSGLVDSTYVLDVRAIDGAGNVSPVLMHEWTLDSRVPSLNVTQRPLAFSAASTQQYVFAIGNITGAPTVTCRVGNQTVNGCQSPWVLTGLPNGTHLASIEVQNAAGSRARFEHQFVVDSVVPTVTIVDSPPSVDISSTARVTFSSSDGTGSGVERHVCRLDAGLEAPCSNSNAHTVANLEDGSHTLDVVAIDRAGNRSLRATVRWVVDAEPDSLLTGLMARWKMDESTGTTLADSVQSNHGQLINFTPAPWSPTGGRKQGALNFGNVSTTRVDVGDVFDFPGRAPFSVSTWVYRSAGGPMYQILVGKTGTSGGTKQGWNLILCNGCSGNLAVQCVRTRDDLVSGGYDKTTPVPLDTWTHLACTYDGTRIRLYRNGALVDASSSSTLALLDHGGRLTIGNNSAGKNGDVRGKMDETRLYNRTLTPAEIAVLAQP